MSDELRAALARLPSGPYEVRWPAAQGGSFTLWGRRGTPPDFADGWAIPLVASGVDTAIYALADILTALGATPALDVVHQPGDPHRYRIQCEVCGQRGQVQLSVEPQGAPSSDPAADDYRKLAAAFWVYYRCGMVGCETVEPHEHGAGPAMREMTAEERGF